VGIVVSLQRANGWIDWRVFGMVWENTIPMASTPDTTAGDSTDGPTVDGAVDGDTIEG
jgi:hypothetical protein